MKYMEKKNMVLLTVIAVATLLVAVVGATFAYFTAQSTTTGNSTTTSATTRELAALSWTAGTDKGESPSVYPGYMAYQSYELTATVDGNISTPYYEWVCSNPLLQLSNINSQTVSYTCTKAGNYDLYLNLYTDSSKSNLLASKVAYLSFNELITPTENDLLISNIKKPNGYGEYFTSSIKFEEEFNKYGVLNTFGLTVYSYLKSEMLNRNFSNVYYQLTQNDDYNVIEYKIFGIANDNITDFAYNIPISIIKEGTNGYNVNKNDKVEIIFKYTRTSGGNFSTNNFDYNAINLSGIVSTDAIINWGDSIGNIASKNLFYTNSWSTNAIIKVNDTIINEKYNQNDNRSVFIFAHKDDRGNNYLDTKWSIRWN